MAHFLIVEDDTILAETLSEWFEMGSHEVDLANNGAAGLALMQAKSFDLILLDWQLPEMEGIDVCQTFRTAGGTTPILMFTGMRDLEFQERALDAGANDVLPKPFDITQLAERVRLLTGV